MSEETHDGRRLDRRGFLGAAAGVAAAGVGATALGALGGTKAARASNCPEGVAEIPKARRGSIFFTLPAAAWNNQAAFLDTIAFFKSLNCNAWEFAGGYPTPAPNNPAGWIALGSYARTYGFRVVGTHDGPNGANANNLGTAVTKMNRWNCNQLGAGSGWPGVPGAGTPLTSAASIASWQASCATMNTWGQAFQTGTGAGVIPTPYGAGVFQGTALTAGRPCARYYRHFHAEQGKWIQTTGTKYDGHYISELVYTELDHDYAFAQADLAWLLDGLWMAGGAAPSIGIQGPGEPNPGQGRNRLVEADLVERYQDAIKSFHVKDLGPNDQGTQVRNVGDDTVPGTATAPFGAQPWDPSQDTVPFQQIFERLRHPECHEFLFERDSMSGTTTSVQYYKKLYVQAFDMFDKVMLDRGPDVVRLPFDFPSTDAEWAATANLPIGARPPAGNGAPGPQCPPEVTGRKRVGDTVTVENLGTWSRFSSFTDSFCFVWLRDGAPHPEYNGAPTGGPGCECCGPGMVSYTIKLEDAGHAISCQVTALNGDDAGTTVVTEAFIVPGNTVNAEIDADLEALHALVISMGLASSPRRNLTNKIDGMRVTLARGGDICPDLDGFKDRVAVHTADGKITAEQKTELDAAADAIKTKLTCS